MCDIIKNTAGTFHLERIQILKCRKERNVRGVCVCVCEREAERETTLLIDIPPVCLEMV